MKKTYIILILSALALTSCKDYLNLVPKNETVVEDVEDVKIEMLAYWASHCYAGYPLPSYGNSELSLPLFNDQEAHLAMYSDDINMSTFKQHSDINEKVMTEYYQDVDWKGRDMAKQLWVDCYATIGFMNAILYDLEKAGPTQSENETIGGEALTIRSWCIFKLLQFFCPLDNDELGVPLNLDSENTTPGGRIAQKKIYAQVEEDMNRVLTYTSTPQKWNFFYTPAFVHSFMAEFYMYKASSPAAESTDWERAEEHASQIVSTYNMERTAEALAETYTASSVGYYPDDDYCALRLATKRTWNLGNSYTGIWGVNNAQQASTELWGQYLPGDTRRDAWFNTKDNGGVTVHYIKKPETFETGPITDLLVLYRKAEIYLIHLEALCHLNRENEAAEGLVKFREARIPGYSTPISDNVLEEIYKERRRELCFENGIRWLDMKRLGLSCSRKGLSKKQSGMATYDLEPNDYRYALPIPTEEELDYNTELNQNPGWTSFD